MIKQKYVIPVLSSSLSYTIAILLTLSIDRWNWPGLYIYIVGFLGVLAASVYAVIVEKKHVEEVEKTAKNIQSSFDHTHNEYVRENRNLCELIVNNELETAAISLVPNIETIRSNIFLPDKADDKLYIAYSYGMKNAPDLTIRLEKNAGCAGHAYHFGEPTVANLVDPSIQLRREWKLENDQIPITSHLKAILAVPVRHPINNQKVIGVLNLDSTDPIAEIFERKDFQEQVQHFALIIAALLWLGSVVERN
jgi:GAF domain-containing protein